MKELFNCGHSVPEIAELLQENTRNVRRWAQGRRRVPATGHPLGRPRKLNDRQERALARSFASHPSVSSRRGTAAWNKLHPEAKISRTSVQHILKSKGLRPYRRKRMPFVTENMRKKRLAFARAFLSVTDWSALVTGDERNAGTERVWNPHNDIMYAQRRDLVPPRTTVKFPKVFTKYLVFMTAAGVFGPYFYDGKMTSAKYIAMLDEAGVTPDPHKFLFPGKRRVPKRAVLLLHDGDSSHTAAATVKHLQDHGVHYIPKNLFPPRSPDLNPTENLFSKIDDIMEQYELPARNIDELKARTVKAVEEINRSKLPERLIRSMSTRIKWVADNKGRFYAQRT